MKYRILISIVTLVALLCVCVTVGASTYDYTISPDDSFTVVKSGENMDNVAKKLNMTTSQLNSYINENGIIYLAVSDDAKSQIKISVFADNFSSEVGDISRLDEQGLSEFANAISKNSDDTADIVSNNGRKFVRITHTRKDTGGIYTITQYVTICNNKTFYFAGYNDGETTSDKISDAFKSFNLTEKVDVPNNYSWYITLIITGVVIFSALAIIMTIQIVRSHLKNKKEQQYEL